MSTYELFKFLHLLGAMAWVGGGVGLFLTSRRLQAAGEHEGMAALVRQSQTIGNRLFMPASLVTIASGVLLVVTESAFRFGDLWVIVGLGGVVLSGVIAMGVAGPVEQRLPVLLAEHPPGAPEVAAALRRVNLASVADLGVLVVVVWAMVAKPVL